MTVNPIVNSVSTGWVFYYILALVMLTDRYIHAIRNEEIAAETSTYYLSGR